MPLSGRSPVAAPEAGQSQSGDGPIRSQEIENQEIENQDIEQIKAEPTDKRSADNWGERISKLRWLGLDDEATGLQLMVRALPAHERGSLLFVWPFCTD
jgi:hypothetical protein